MSGICSKHYDPNCRLCRIKIDRAEWALIKLAEEYGVTDILQYESWDKLADAVAEAIKASALN